MPQQLRQFEVEVDGRRFVIEAATLPTEQEVRAKIAEQPTAPSPAAPQNPARGGFAGYNMLGDFAKDLVKPDNWGSLGAGIGGTIGGIGGTVGGVGVGGVPGAIGGATLGGGAGESARQLYERFLGSGNAPSSSSDAASAIGTEGALQGALQGATAGLGKGVQMVGSGLYRAGVLPIQQILGKYGDIVKTGVKNGILATEGGMAKAGAMKSTAMAAKKAALEDAGARVTFLPGGVANEAQKQLRGKLQPLVRAGEVTNLQAKAAGTPIEHFRAQGYSGGGITPTELEAVKGTLDDRLGGAYQNLRQKKPISGREMSRMALSQTASRAQESAVPGYRAMNKDIMDAAGLEQAIKRRTVGSGGNQGLENALTMAATAAGSSAAIPARLAMLPPVLTGLGIAADRVGGGVSSQGANALRALLALLQPEQQDHKY